jgi:hypothetical protein
MATPKIVVAGDLVLEHHLARRHAGGPALHGTGEILTRTLRAGGAWAVAEALRTLLEGTGEAALSADVLAPLSPLAAQGAAPQPATVTSAHWVWALAGKEKVWRAVEFLGHEPPGPSAAATRQVRTADPPDPDLLVLHDEGLGFSAREDLWPAALRDGGAPREILAVAADRLEGRLWAKLLAPELAGKVTLVVGVDTLRSHGAVLTRAQSWDRVGDDLRSEAAAGVIASICGGCSRLFVVFGAEGVGILTRADVTPDGRGGGLRFDRLILDPDALEGAWLSHKPGLTVRPLAPLAAMTARHLLHPETFPIYIALCRGLAAVRETIEAGGGTAASGLNWSSAQERWAGICAIKKDDKKKPEAGFSAAFPRELLDDSVIPGEPTNPSLLTDIVGDRVAFLMAKADEILVRGVDTALGMAPKARYGAFLTFDREEIERVNSVRTLMDGYRLGHETKPLSIAVFGAPGSGKSFAIKQLAKELFGGDRNILEFNLSQFESVRDLHEAFHKVRDLTLQGLTPLVFWDEFDTAVGGQRLAWLKDFLAPMQDGQFQANGYAHPLGRAVYVFAGGTACSFKDFLVTKGSTDWPDFVKAKGPDFVSRLRGYVNIKGPNPVDARDHACLIRRAILLASLVERYHGPGVVLSPGIRSGLLGVEKFEHGARSMEAVVSLSHLRDSRRFSLASLPPRELLDIHLSPDFMEKALAGERLRPPVDALIEEIARGSHESWRKAKEEQGWTYGPIRNDALKVHNLLKPYDELDEDGKEGNRQPARITFTRLTAVGFEVRRAAEQPVGAVDRFSDEEKRLLAISEHQRWMRERLTAGYEQSEHGDDTLRQSKVLKPFSELDKDARQLDYKMIAAVWEVLPRHGLVLVRRPPAQAATRPNCPTANAGS